MNGLENLQLLNISLYKNPRAYAFLKRDLFKGLTSLKILDLSGYKFRFLDDQFLIHLVNLTKLILIDFRLENSAGSPNQLFNFTNKLESLDISFQSFSIEPHPIGNLVSLTKLKHLGLRNRGLDHNSINSLSFSPSHRIASLDLSFNKLNINIFESLAFMSSSLERLNLNNNQISLLDRPVIAENGSILLELKELCLKGNIQVQLNVSHFSSLRRLRVLDLAFNSIELLTVRSFQGLSQLEHLKLTDNVIQTIENGTFVPLVNLVSVDLRKNMLRNLYLFGLSRKCAVFHDGLSVFNISFIDLRELSHEKQERFLQKTLHFLGSKRLSIYRNIMVSWRSTSSRPDCSLYFQVLREYKLITFDINPAYLEECSSKDLTLSSQTFCEEKLSESSDVISWVPALKISPEVKWQGTTSDGYLFGIAKIANISDQVQIVAIKLDQMTSNYTFRVGERAENLVIISDDLMISVTGGNSSDMLWNIREKSNISLLLKIPHRFVQRNTFAYMENQLVSFDSVKKIFCVLDYASGYLNCQEYFFDPQVTLLYKRFLLQAAGKNFDIINFRDWIHRNYTELSRINTDHQGVIDTTIITPNGLLVSISDGRDIKIWTVLDSGHLELKGFTNIRFEKIALLQSIYNNDTLIATVFEKVFKIWSLRFGKLIAKARLPHNPTTFLSSFNQGLLIIDDGVFQF